MQRTPDANGRTGWHLDLAARAWIVAVAGLLMLALLFATLWRGVLDQQTTALQRTEARQVQTDALNLTIAMVDQETGLRGYTVTGQEMFLQPYLDGRTQASQTLQRLRTETRGGSFQPTTNAVSTTVAAWSTWAEARREVIATAHGPIVDVAGDDRGKALFDQFRNTDNRLIQMAAGRAQDALRRATAATSTLQWALLLGGIPIVLSLVALGALMTVSVLRPLRALAAAADGLARGEPTGVPATDRQHEVGALARALARWQHAEATKRDLTLSIVELSTPVFRLKPGLLLIPIIGALDDERAHQLTQQLLQAVRREGTQFVVVDVTGAYSIDSRVAAHLMRAAKCCRLLGARVILTGLSTESADALVRLGVSLATLLPAGDLEDGIDEAERKLGNRTALSVADAVGAHSG